MHSLVEDVSDTMEDCCLGDTLKHFNISKEIIARFKCNTRLFISHITTLSERLENGEIDIDSEEINQILSDKGRFTFEIDQVKNQLEEIKNHLTRLELNQGQLIRKNRGRCIHEGQNPKTGNNVDSGISSVTSGCLDSRVLSLSSFDGDQALRASTSESAICMLPVMQETSKNQDETNGAMDLSQSSVYQINRKDASTAVAIATGATPLETQKQNLNLPETSVTDTEYNCNLSETHTEQISCENNENVMAISECRKTSYDSRVNIATSECHKTSNDSDVDIKTLTESRVQPFYSLESVSEGNLSSPSPETDARTSSTEGNQPSPQIEIISSSTETSRKPSEHEDTSNSSFS